MKQVGDIAVTPYGPAPIIEVNLCYGVKVQFENSQSWFKWWEIGELEPGVPKGMSV